MSDRNPDPPRLPRLRAILRRLAWAVAAGLLLAIWAVLIEPGWVVTREHQVAPAGWRGPPLRAALLADLHVGAPHVDLDALDDIVARTNAAKPDVVFLLGDYVIDGVIGGTKTPMPVIAARLQHLEAPLGVYAVLGNHDWWNDGAAIRAELERVGITVLDDEAVALPRRQGRPLWLVGLADAASRAPNPSAATERVPTDADVVAITHSPDVFPQVPTRVAATFAGHTHGGQIRLPFVGALVVPSEYGRRYQLGWIEEQGHGLFVSGGIGTSILPIRLGMRPGVDIVTLSAAGDDALPN